MCYIIPFPFRCETPRGPSLAFLWQNKDILGVFRPCRLHHIGYVYNDSNDRVYVFPDVVYCVPKPSNKVFGCCRIPNSNDIEETL